MTAFRAFLIFVGVTLAAYTAVVIANHGIGLLSVFFGDMRTIGWPGQFNLDFAFMLTFSAIWVAWRHQWSALGLVLAALAFFFGSLFLATYLSILSWQTRGDVPRILLGGRGAVP